MNTTFANHDNAELGLVLVSTGVLKLRKPFENLAYAA